MHCPLCRYRHSGHGKETLASLLATFNLTAFLMQSAADLVCESWREARALSLVHS